MEVIVRVYEMVSRQNVSDMCWVALRINIEAHHLPPQSFERAAYGPGASKQLEAPHLSMQQRPLAISGRDI